MVKAEAAAEKRRRRQRSAALNVASSLCSVASVAFCVLLSVNAADIRSRVTGLEAAGGQHSSFLCAPGFSLEDFNSLVEQSVDERLSQVSLPPVMLLLLLFSFRLLPRPLQACYCMHS